MSSSPTTTSSDERRRRTWLAAFGRYAVMSAMLTVLGAVGLGVLGVDVGLREVAGAMLLGTFLGTVAAVARTGHAHR